MNSGHHMHLGVKSDNSLPRHSRPSDDHHTSYHDDCCFVRRSHATRPRLQWPHPRSLAPGTSPLGHTPTQPAPVRTGFAPASSHPSRPGFAKPRHCFPPHLCNRPCAAPLFSNASTRRSTASLLWGEAIVAAVVLCGTRLRLPLLCPSEDTASCFGRCGCLLLDPPPSPALLASLLKCEPPARYLLAIFHGCRAPSLPPRASSATVTLATRTHSPPTTSSTAPRPSVAPRPRFQGTGRHGASGRRGRSRLGRRQRAGDAARVPI